MDAEELDGRTDLDPRAAPGVHRWKLADGVYVDWPMDSIGYRQPSKSDLMALGGAFVGQEVGIFNVWASECLIQPRQDDLVVQGGEEWVVRISTARVFRTRYQLTCTKAVGAE